jgi:hypothetical protein
VAERRAHAARCRAALTGSLALVAVVGWVLVGFGQVFVWAPAIPTVALAGAVVAGRRVALAQARADIARYGRVPSAQARARAAGVAAREAERRGPASSARLPAPVAITEAELGAVLLAEGVDTDGLELVMDASDAAHDAGARHETGELAVRAGRLAPGAAHGAVTGERKPAGTSLTGAGSGTAGLVEAPGAAARAAEAGVAEAGVAAARVAEAGLAAAGQVEARVAEARASGGQNDRGWMPPHVPAPAYTLREQAERREPKPLTEADYEAARDAASRLTAAGPSETGMIALPPRVIFGESAIDIDTAIMKRRASGGGR